jgi:hypothetical protein
VNAAHIVHLAVPLTPQQSQRASRAAGLSLFFFSDRCGALWCSHESVLDVSAYTDDVTVPSFGPRMVCTVCGAIGADVRPNWNERAPPSLFGSHSCTQT